LIYLNIGGHNQIIQFFCDGKSVLDRIIHHQVHGIKAKDYLLLDMDVESQIHLEINELKTMGINIKFNFVKGHQKIVESSPVQVIFNDMADNLASQQLQQRENSCVPHDILPSMRAYMEFKTEIILGNY
jgi:hypothetical protein